MHAQPKLQSQTRTPFSLDKATVDRFLQHCTRTSYPSKKNIFAPGDRAGTLYYVVSGSLAVISEETTENNRKSRKKDKKKGKLGHAAESSSQDANSQTVLPDDLVIKSDQELVLGYVNAGEFVGEMGLFLPTTTTRHVCFRTRTASEVAEIDYDKLLTLMAPGGELANECPKILYNIGGNISKRLFSVSRKASGLAFVDVTERILRTVFELAQHPEALTHPQGMQIKASRQELARLSGCSREMAGRALKQLEEDGKLTAHGKTIVLFCDR